MNKVQDFIMEPEAIKTAKSEPVMENTVECKGMSDISFVRNTKTMTQTIHLDPYNGKADLIIVSPKGTQVADLTDRTTFECCAAKLKRIIDSIHETQTCNLQLSNTWIEGAYRETTFNDLKDMISIIADSHPEIMAGMIYRINRPYSNEVFKSLENSKLPDEMAKTLFKVSNGQCYPYDRIAYDAPVVFKNAYNLCCMFGTKDAIWLVENDDDVYMTLIGHAKCNNALEANEQRYKYRGEIYCNTIANLPPCYTPTHPLIRLDTWLSYMDAEINGMHKRKRKDIEISAETMIMYNNVISLQLALFGELDATTPKDLLSYYEILNTTYHEYRHNVRFEYLLMRKYSQHTDSYDVHAIENDHDLYRSWARLYTSPILYMREDDEHRASIITMFAKMTCEKKTTMLVFDKDHLIEAFGMDHSKPSAKTMTAISSWCDAMHLKH